MEVTRLPSLLDLQQLTLAENHFTDLARGLATYCRQEMMLSTDIGRVLQSRHQLESLTSYITKLITTRDKKLEVQNILAEARIRQERYIGEWLEQHITRGRTKMLHHATFPRLTDLGIERTQSHRWQQIATLSEEDFECYLTETQQRHKELTTAGVLRLARGQMRAAAIRDRQQATNSIPIHERGNFFTDLVALASTGKTFGCIYADPPWSYRNQATRASTHNHYSTMTVDAICQLPIGDLAAPQSHLHLWTTNAFLFECPKIFAAWGFEFKSSFIWVKPRMGIGNYWRNSHEFLLLGVRGGLTAQHHGLQSWMQADRTSHSTKPEHIRDAVEQLSPGPYLELFGRSRVPGWVVWGNECVPSNGRLFKTGVAS